MRVWGLWFRRGGSAKLFAAGGTRLDAAHRRGVQRALERAREEAGGGPRGWRRVREGGDAAVREPAARRAELQQRRDRREGDRARVERGERHERREVRPRNRRGPWEVIYCAVFTRGLWRVIGDADSGKKYQCKFCDKTFAAPDDRIRHCFDVHSKLVDLNGDVLRDLKGGKNKNARNKTRANLESIITKQKAELDKKVESEIQKVETTIQQSIELEKQAAVEKISKLLGEDKQENEQNTISLEKRVKQVLTNVFEEVEESVDQKFAFMGKEIEQVNKRGLSLIFEEYPGPWSSALAETEEEEKKREAFTDKLEDLDAEVQRLQNALDRGESSIVIEQLRNEVEKDASTVEKDASTLSQQFPERMQLRTAFAAEQRNLQLINDILSLKEEIDLHEGMQETMRHEHEKEKRELEEQITTSIHMYQKSETQLRQKIQELTDDLNNNDVVHTHNSQLSTANKELLRYNNALKDQIASLQSELDLSRGAPFMTGAMVPGALHGVVDFRW